MRGLPESDTLRAIVSKALARDREARYVSAAAMFRDLEAYAASARLMTSPLQLGDWLEKTFGESILARRRARERAAAALERGAPLIVQPIAVPVATVSEPYRIDVDPPTTGKLPPSSSPSSPSPPLAAIAAPSVAVTRRADHRVALVVLVVLLVLSVAAAVVMMVLRAR